MKSVTPNSVVRVLRRKSGIVARGCVDLTRDRTILTLSLLFGLTAAGLLWHQTRQRSQLVESTVVQHAAQYSEVVAEFRTLYTMEVVKPAIEGGIEVSHDYRDKPGVIPLPATLSMLLGNRLAEKGGGGRVRLYSPHPFPWRSETGGLRDEFAREAWEALEKRPDDPFLRFEDVDGRPSLRYATADLMRSSCIGCHNRHPDSPKRDWKEGNVRGVLEVVLPLDAAVAQTHAALRESAFVVAGLFVVGLACMWLIVTRFRRTAMELEKRVAERTRESQDRAAKLTRSNADLEKIVAELREFNELTEGREVRMLELKTEINELAARFGEPDRYDVDVDEEEAHLCIAEGAQDD